MNQSLFYQNSLALVTIIFYLIVPQVFESMQYILFALVILFIGIPHGAMDHVIDAAIDRWNPKSINLKFYGWYLGAIGAYSILWYFYPFLSFMLFFVMTAYHFGQSDVHRLRLTENFTKLLIPFRGLLLIFFILLGDLRFSSDVIATVTSFNWFEWVSKQQQLIEYIYLGVTGFYLVLVSLANIKSKKGWKDSLLSLTEVLLLYGLFNFTNSLIAFSFYFGFWHSYEHVKVMSTFLKESTGEQLTLKGFYEKALSFSLIIYLAMLFVYNILEAYGEAKLMIALLLIMISVLTLPHMLVVEKLYKSEN